MSDPRGRDTQQATGFIGVLPVNWKRPVQVLTVGVEHLVILQVVPPDVVAGVGPTWSTSATITDGMVGVGPVARLV